MAMLARTCRTQVLQLGVHGFTCNASFVCQLLIVKGEICLARVVASTGVCETCSFTPCEEHRMPELGTPSSLSCRSSYYWRAPSEDDAFAQRPERGIRNSGLLSSLLQRFSSK